MQLLRRLRPSPAMVVACIALGVALGGTSLAAIQALPRNSVGTKQLKKNAVTSPKVKNNAITGADVNEATLGRVPSATNATNATNATSATTAANATNATNAANANTLGGIPASGFLRSTRDGGGALAGANVNADGTVNAFFNRFGGAPSVSHTGASGVYVITFPGLEGKLLNSQVIHMATLFNTTGEIWTSSSGGNPYVSTRDSAGALSDRSFYYTVFGTNLAP